MTRETTSPNHRVSMEMSTDKNQKGQVMATIFEETSLAWAFRGTIINRNLPTTKW